MRDTSVTGTLLRRPGPPKVLSVANKAVIDDPRLLDVLDPDTPLLCLYEHATLAKASSGMRPARGSSGPMSTAAGCSDGIRTDTSRR